jgi:hypothetical protein
LSIGSFGGPFLGIGKYGKIWKNIKPEILGALIVPNLLGKCSIILRVK